MKPPPDSATIVAQATVQKDGTSLWSRSAALRKARAAAGLSVVRAIARSVCRARPVMTAASVPFPQTSPTTTVQRPASAAKKS